MKKIVTSLLIMIAFSFGEAEAQVPSYSASPSATIKPFNLGIKIFPQPTAIASATPTITSNPTISPVASTMAASLTTQPQTGVDMGVWVAILAILVSGLGLWRIAWVRAKGV